MRILLAFVFCLSLVPYTGCQKKPDPRDRPGFVDTSTNPAAIPMGKGPGGAAPGAKPQAPK